MRTALVFAATLVLVPACSPATTACTPGASVACTGPGGCSGGQVCRSDGSGYEACVCGVDGGMADAPSGPPLICDSGLGAATAACAACMSAACCAEATACVADPECTSCLGSGGAPGCSATLDALESCRTTMCATDCS